MKVMTDLGAVAGVSAGVSAGQGRYSHNHHPGDSLWVVVQVFGGPAGTAGAVARASTLTTEQTQQARSDGTALVAPVAVAAATYDTGSTGVADQDGNHRRRRSKVISGPLRPMNGIPAQRSPAPAWDADTKLTTTTGRLGRRRNYRRWNEPNMVDRGAQDQRADK